MNATPRLVLCGLCLLALAGCATHAEHVRPEPTPLAEFATWGCSRVADEADRVQQRAADVAYAVDERAGNNILALGVGLTVFWPALLALRPDGLEAAELARLKGRYEALQQVAAQRGCELNRSEPSPEQVAALPVAVGERLVYEDRAGLRQPSVPWVLTVAAVRRGEIEYRLRGDGRPGAAEAVWRQDLAGNVLQAPDGALAWRRLMRSELALGQVVHGEMVLTGDPQARARLRGQVVALGPHTVAERRFDAAVIELFGDAEASEGFSRVDGAIVGDRHSGVLLRLELRSAQSAFSLQRRLMRVEAAAP
jgi:hypothetical protein